MGAVVLLLGIVLGGYGYHTGTNNFAQPKTAKCFSQAVDQAARNECWYNKGDSKS